VKKSSFASLSSLSLLVSEALSSCSSRASASAA
jgi:hypothetical protein